MALNADQKAMLRLLAQREQGYEDIASLMGIGVGEVRARVAEALDELDGPDSPEAEPVAPRIPEKAPKPAPPEPRESVKATPPPAKGRKRPPTFARPRPGVRLPSDSRARLGIAAGAALLVVLVLIVVLSGGDGDSSGASAGSGDGGSAATANNPNLTQAVLSPVDGSDASGRAVFGRVDRTAVLQVDADGLEPSPAGRSYAVWLYRSPQVVLRIGAVRVGGSGSIAAQFPLPTQLLAYIAGGAFNQIDISLTSNAAYRAEVAAARRERRLPALTGDSVLRGRITGRLIRAGRAAR